MAELEKLLCTDSKVESLKKINALMDKTEKSGSGFNLFDTKLSDHVLTFEESQGWALQGTYVYKEAVAGSRYGYPDFYAKCLEEYENATSTETVNSVSVKVYSNGHKFYDIADKSAIDTFYNTYGIADFYGVDTENERILLPRNNYFFQLTGDTSKVNDYVEAGLPNITGSIDYHIYSTTSAGAFYDNGGEYRAGGTTASGSKGSRKGFDASRSSSIYGNSDTVQPPSSKKLLYYCVGNTVSNTSWVDVVTQVEGGVKDLEDKTLEGIERLKASSNALTTTQITNCITEIPQRINIELNDGTLTLKAGSTVIIPNGFEDDGVTPKFDEITITSDLSHSSTSGTEGSTVSLFYETSGRLVYFSYSAGQITSGSEQPTGTYRCWYDTTTNLIKHTDNNEAWQTTYMSLPICLGNSSAEYVFASIDQVFNGIGYIGSTVWVDKGVKGLIPNGRNEDGTLNNIEFEAERILTLTKTDSYSRNNADILLSKDGVLSFTNIRYEVQKDGYIYNQAGTMRLPYFSIGLYSCNEDSITTLTPKLPFRAIDYSKKSTVSGWSLPSSKYINLTVGASGSAYTAPANGWVRFTYTVSSQGGWGSIQNTTSSVINGNTGSYWTGGSFGLSIPVKKGDVFKPSFDGVNNQTLRFIYAEGEV